MIIDQPISFAFILESKQFSFTSAAAPRNSQLTLFPHSVRCQISCKTKNLIKTCRVWVEQMDPKPVTAAVFLKSVRVYRWERLDSSGRMYMEEDQILLMHHGSLHVSSRSPNC